VNSFRLASIDLITPTVITSGDAHLVCPGGRAIDLAWGSERPEPSARWSPLRMLDSLGVITVEVTEQVEVEGHLGPVLETAVVLMEPILAADIHLLR
jgi:hypothetical protein